jgi:hypothetical protein
VFREKVVYETHFMTNAPILQTCRFLRLLNRRAQRAGSVTLCSPHFYLFVLLLKCGPCDISAVYMFRKDVILYIVN